MITKEEIKECIAECRRNGHIVNEVDIAYLLLNREFRDKSRAYRIAYGSNANDSVVEANDTSGHIKFLRSYMNEHWAKRPEPMIDAEEIAGDITFEENRDALIKYLSDIQRLVNDKKIDPKDGMKMMTDIRLKLNDKFNIKEAQVEQRIVVQPKFNHICQHTHKECWLQTEQFAMEHWHLIKDPKYKE